MKQLHTKSQILEYLKLHTRTFDSGNMTAFTTTVISKHLNLSRSVTSQYLNELYKEKELIKINSRPVYFLHRILLEKKFQKSLSMEEYLSLEEFLAELLKDDLGSRKDFAEIIGYESSLYDCIIQMKSALIYPQGGLPMILYGENGSGKSFLIQKLYDHCINKRLFPKSAKLITVNIVKNHPVTLTEELFGSQERKGLIEQANGGILHIRHASNLSFACQEKLSDYLEEAKTTLQKRVKKSQTRLIFTTCSDPYERLTQGLVLKVPVISRVPNLDERTREEREDFIIHFFQLEQLKMNRNLLVSKHLFEELLQVHFDNNINDLQKCITSICAKVYMRFKDTEMTEACANLHDMDFEWLRHTQLSLMDTQEQIMLDINHYKKNNPNIQILELFNNILSVHQEYLQNQKSFSQFSQEGYQYMRQYYDFVVFEEQKASGKVAVIEKLIDDLLELIKNQYQMNLPLNCSFILARMIYSTQKMNSTIGIWEQEHKQAMKACLSTLKQELSEASILSENIVRRMQTSLDLKLSDIHIIFLTLNINFYNKDIKNQDIIGIVLSHGYSTASSIADAVNYLLGVQVFQAIDMPMDTAMEEIAMKVKRFISTNPSYKNILLMVDMGSLEDIGEKLHNNVNIGVINNISTAVALNIGTKILKRMDLEEILRSTCEEAKCSYRILNHADKEKAIVFTNDAGIKISERLAKLFKNSLPRAIDLKFLEYDYQSLLQNGLNEVLFKKYDVILMVKPASLVLPQVNSVSLEDIVSFKDIDKVNKALTDDLNFDEIELFNQQLLKNFSMQSVMENLTILNPVKLLDYVSESINNLQILLRTKFQSKTIVGIYIHICFLVERLVTQNAIASYEGIETFVTEQPLFIDYVHKSFETMLKHYNVQMPIGEIAYLHDYIVNDKQLGDMENEEL